MQKTRIEWVAKGKMAGYVWNPLGWGCLGGCSYCYARRFAQRGMSKCPKCRAFEPHFHPERLHDPAMLQHPARVFVCSMSDLFGPWSDDAWITAVLFVIKVNPEHEFILLTKHPEIMCAYTIPDNAWAGITVTNQADADERIPLLLQVPAKRQFVSVEPLLGPVDLGTWFRSAMDDKRRCAISWLILGGLTPKPVHKPGWGKALVDQCDAAGVPVYVKNNFHTWFEGWDRRDLP